MPNGSDPVWMETIRIEIARHRLRSHAPHCHSRVEKSVAEIDNGAADDVPQSDFTVTVWNRVKELRRSQRDKVRVVDV